MPDEHEELSEDLTGIKTDAGDIVDKAEDAVKVSDQLIDEWFVRHFHNLEQLPTELFNKFRAAKDELKKLF